MKNTYALQYKFLITALALYYVFYTLAEYPYALTLYSVEQGFNSYHNFGGNYFYNLYEYIADNALLLKSIFLLKAVFALGLFVDPIRKTCYGLILVHSIFFDKLGSVGSPEMMFLNFLLLMLIMVPEEKFSFFKSYKRTFWMYPKYNQYLVWIVAGVAYSISGYYKFLTPGWRNGTFLHLLLNESHLRNFEMKNLLNTNFMIFVCGGLTYFSFFAELLALPMVFNKYTRLICFIVLTAMHVIILILMDVAEISWGMLVFHIYLFEPQWLRLFNKLKRSNRKSLL